MCCMNATMQSNWCCGLGAKNAHDPECRYCLVGGFFLTLSLSLLGFVDCVCKKKNVYVEYNILI